MKGAAVVLLASALAVRAASGAEPPDQSERFREALSACVLPGPGLAARAERLESLGWREVPAEGIRAAYADAEALRDPPATATPEAWRARRSDAAAAGLPEDVTVFASGRSLVVLSQETGTGNPACLLLTLNSRESDLLLADLADYDALEDGAGVRRGGFLSRISDDGGAGWSTEITVSSLDPAIADALFATPPAATFVASFITRPER